MIHFDEFGWQFADASAWALNGVSLRIHPGEFVAVAGPSGSGKTTLALAMCGLLIGRHAGDARGSVQIGGHDVATTPLHQVAQSIGLVQQNPETHFATLSVGDEVAFGMENRCLPREEIRKACDNALELLGITHLRDRDLSSLSGGEKQRVAVASMIAGGPDALILDEPTASLDPETSRDLFRALADLSRRTGLTVVIIEHKLAQLLPLEPRLVCLEVGRVVADLPGGRIAGNAPAWLRGPRAVRVGERVCRPAQAPGNLLVDMSHLTVEIDGHVILNDVSLHVRAGEVVAVLGPNGGGKSTLLQCLLGLLPTAHGSLQTCGVDASPAATSRLARHVGLVFQNADHQLFAESVWREALFAAQRLEAGSATLDEDAARLLEHAGLLDRRADHPYRLSWGQKRRLNLISAVLHHPRLILLDEPFAGQDWENAAFLLDVIKRVVDGPLKSPGDRGGASERGACLMVTHDPRIVLRSCTRVLFLAGGRVTLDAPVPQAFESLRAMELDVYVPAEYLRGERQPAALDHGLRNAGRSMG